MTVAFDVVFLIAILVAGDLGKTPGVTSRQLRSGELDRTALELVVEHHRRFAAANLTETDPVADARAKNALAATWSLCLADRSEPLTPTRRARFELCIRAADRVSPTYAVNARHLYAGRLLAEGENDEARRWFAEAFPRSTNHRLREDTGRRLIELLLLAHRWDEAKAVLDTLEAELSPGATEARARLLSLRADRYRAMGLFDRASTVMKECLEVADALGAERPYNLDVALTQRHVNLLLAQERHDQLIETIRAFGIRHPKLPPSLSLRLAIALVTRELPGTEVFEAEANFVLVRATSEASALDYRAATRRLAQYFLAVDRWSDAAALLDELEQTPFTQSSLHSAYEAALRCEWTRRADRSTTERRAALARLTERHDRVIAGLAATEPRVGGLAPLQFHSHRFVLLEQILAIRELDGDEAAVTAGFTRLDEIQQHGVLSRRLIERRAETTAGVTAAAAPGENEVQCFFLPGPHESAWIARTRDNAWLWTTLSRDALVRLRNSWLAELRTPPPSDATERERLLKSRAETGEALAAELVPVELQQLWLERGRVTLVAPDVFDQLPYPVLPVNGVPLGHRCDLGSVPSLTALGILRTENTASPDPSDARALFVTAPTHAPAATERFPHLVALDAEAIRQSGIYDGYRDPLVLTGDAATDEALAAAAPEAIISQVLVHGVQDYERERSSGLVLAPRTPSDDGLRWADDLESWHAAPLMIVTACAVGSGPRRAGDTGVSSLIGATLLAGADCVLIARSPVHLAPTLELSREFHAGLQRGATPAAALRKARVALADSQWSDPYYLASFEIWGDGHRTFPTPAPRGTKLIWWMVAGCGVLFVLFFRRLRRVKE